MALAAIQGLYQLLQEKDGKLKQVKVANAQMRTEMDKIKTQLTEFNAMKSRMAKLEAAMQKMEILTAKKDHEKKNGATETAEVAAGSE